MLRRYDVSRELFTIFEKEVFDFLIIGREHVWLDLKRDVGRVLFGILPVTPVIDRQFALENVADAIRYSETGRARGKILIRID